MNFDKLAESLAPPEPMTGNLEYSAMICWGPGQRYLDFDGAVGTLKAYVDLLDKAGWMVDDRQIKRADVGQMRSREYQYVYICVKEI